MPHDVDGERDWEAIRLAVAAGELTRNAICRQFLISRGALERRIKDNHWNSAPRDDAGDQLKLIDALFWALERLIDHMGRVELDSDGTKEATALNRVADTLDKLIAMAGRTGEKQGQVQSREMLELRDRISRRLSELDVR